MRTSRQATIRIQLSLLGLISCLAAPLTAEYAGRIIGRVVAAETGRPLNGVAVRIRGDAITDVTDELGRYILSRVPTGDYLIEVMYLGRRPTTQEVRVEAGSSVTADFALEVSAVALGEVSVLGVRATGQAAALTRQMNAPNVKHIVAADQMGRFPDANAPEAVQRLPGIAIERDQGDGRYIQIRGASAQNTLVTFNGEEVPSPEGDVRQIALDAVPVEILESIEVSKAIAPDMDADAIGGTVNLVTRKAPDRPLFSVEGAGGYSSIREDAGGSASVTLGGRMADGKVGALVSGSFNRRNFGSDDIEPEYDIGGAGLADDALEALEVRHYTLWRERRGATGTVDYRPEPGSVLSVTGTYSELRDEEQRRILLNAVADGELAFQHKNRLEELETYNITFAGAHTIRSGFGVDYHVTYARSSEDTPYDTEIEFLQEGVSFAPDISDPDNIQANPDAAAVAGTYLFDNIQPASSITTNRNRVAALNLSLPYRFGATTAGALKVGVKFRQKDKDQNVTEEEFQLVDGAPDIVLGQGVGGPFDPQPFNPGAYAFPATSTSPDDVIDFQERNAAVLEGELNLEEETNDYQLEERVIGVYAMTELNLTPSLMILPGVRFEHTRFESTGFEFDPDDETLTERIDERSYGRVFPMVHIRYSVTPRTNIRAAFTTAMFRPNFFDLVPYRIRDDDDLVLGNPDLDPTISRNADLLFEHYEGHIGVMSAGFFYKRLEHPIFVFSEDNQLGGKTEQPRNGEAGEIFGFEVAVQQQLRMLPPPLDGLGIYANYTYTDSEATLPGGRTARLQGQADHVVNAAVSYEKGGFSGQLSFNFHDAFVTEYGGDTGDPEERFEDVFVDSHRQLDLAASYRLFQTTALFVEVVNLTNEPFRLFQGVDDRPRQAEFYETWARFGFRYTT